MRILLTGASGFIGSNLLRALCTDSNLSILAVSRRVPQQDLPGVRHYALDLSRPGWTCALEEPVDAVIHLAQSDRYRQFPEGASDMVAVNVSATVELADWARTKGIRRFLFASTGNVYPTNLPRPLTEDDEPSPALMYGATKLAAETLLAQYAPWLEVVLMRLFGVYGPGQTGMLVPNLIQRILCGEPLTLGRQGGIHLSPLYVSDCVAMIRALLEAPLPTRVERVNLGGGQSLGLARIIAELEDALAAKATVVSTEEPPTYLMASIERLQSLAGLRPSVDFREGVRRILEATN